MGWPTPQDYNEAIQNPRYCFLDAELRDGRPALTNLGLPRPITGNFASVYCLDCGSRQWAVRCFLKDFHDQKTRYALIGAYLAKIKLPYTVGFQFLDEGIRIRGNWYPILKMEWIRGKSLDAYIGDNVRDSTALSSLAIRWVRMIAELEKVDLAHGDLQHGNILVVNGDFKLIDYDGMYVPPFAGFIATSHELGDPNYQHPRRTGHDFDGRLDRFSAWIIYLSLVALAEDPSLWTSADAGIDHLLLRGDDLKNPQASKTFNLLMRRTSGETAALAQQIVALLSQHPLSLPSLAQERYKPVGAGWLTDHVQASEAIEGISTHDLSDDPATHSISDPSPVTGASWLSSATELTRLTIPPALHGAPMQGPMSGDERAPASLHVAPSPNSNIEMSAHTISWLDGASHPEVATAPVVPQLSASTEPSNDLQTESVQAQSPLTAQDNGPVVGNAMSTPALLPQPPTLHIAVRVAPFRVLAAVSLLATGILASGMPLPSSSLLVHLGIVSMALLLVNIAVVWLSYRSHAAQRNLQSLRRALAQEQSQLNDLNKEIADTKTTLQSLATEFSDRHTGLAALRTLAPQRQAQATQEVDTERSRQLEPIDRALAEAARLAMRAEAPTGDLQRIDHQLLAMTRDEEEKARRRLRSVQADTEHEYVQQHGILHAEIPDMPEALRKRLHAMGLRTATDITYDRIKTIPEVDGKQALALMKWKYSITLETIAQIPASLPQADLDAIAQPNMARRKTLESERDDLAQRHAAQLAVLRSRHTAERQQLDRRRLQVNEDAVRRIAEIMAQFDISCIDNQMNDLQAESSQHRQSLEERLQRTSKAKAKRVARIKAFEHELDSYRWLTFKRYIRYIYASD